LKLQERSRLSPDATSPLDAVRDHINRIVEEAK